MPGERVASAQRQSVILLYGIFQRLFKPLQPLARLFVEQSGEKGLLVGKRAAGESGSEAGLRLPQRFCCWLSCWLSVRHWLCNARQSSCT
ncbi:Uncharacterised protein [Raoultella ornithinolytica]|nr:Uncharacterised protein [Raoultella ornithinolytica]